jgi:hypothetical protein
MCGFLLWDKGKFHHVPPSIAPALDAAQVITDNAQAVRQLRR